MKKKVVSLFASMVMLVAVFAPQVVNAAASPSAGSPSAIVVSLNAKDCVLPANTSLSVGAISTKNLDIIKATAQAKGVKGTLEGAWDINLLDSTGAGYVLKDGEKATLNFTATNLKAADIVTVLHLLADGTVEIIKANSNDNFFTFNVTSFSPYAVFVDRVSTTTTPNTTTPVSPSTGVYN